jgi:hypothetical protein
MRRLLRVLWLLGATAYAANFLAVHSSYFRWTAADLPKDQSVAADHIEPEK